MFTLPDSIFVPVPARRLAAPDVAWFDRRRIDLPTVLAHAYAVPQQSEPDALYGKEWAEWHADRYGGAARAGVRIEGIGRTPLADPASPGAVLPVSEAGAAVIWSRILAVALPHGAVPAYALVLTGGAFRQADTPDGALRSRAVVLRQFTPRPAHYLDEAASGAAVDCLADAFQFLFGDAVSRSGGVETINDGLRLVARRYAEQLAASFAKRIFTGATDQVALALDGRVLECGAARHVPGYRRATGDARATDQWTQHEPVMGTLRALRRRIGERLPALTDVLAEDELVHAFRSALGRARELHLLKMTGLPAGFIRQEKSERRTRLYHCLRDIYRLDNERLDHERWGAARDLSGILAGAAAVPAEDLDGVLRPCLDDNRLRREFIDAYADARERFVAAHPAYQRMHARLLFVLQASRLNADLAFLAGGLGAALRPFDAEPAGVGAAIDAIAARGRYLLADQHPGLGGQHALAQVDSLERLGPALPAFVAACLDKAGAAPDVHLRVRQWLGSGGGAAA